MSRARHFLAPLLAASPPAYILRNQRTGQAVARELEMAVDSKSRRRGLLGRAGLAPDTALIIAPCNSVHTFFMQFPIDVVFTSRAGTVLGVSRAVKPWRIALSLRAFAAIELAAETAAGTVVGDQLDVVLPTGAATAPGT